MKELQLPKGHQTIMPYLILTNAEGFLAFVTNVFGAVEHNKTMRDDEKTIMHAEVSVGSSTIMFAQSTPEFQPQVAGLFIYVANADETYNKALAAGAQTIMPPDDKDYGRTCGVTDPNGVTWWITSAPGQ